MNAIVAKPVHLHIDGTAERSAHLLFKATHAVSLRVKGVWQDAYERNEALRLRYVAGR